MRKRFTTLLLAAALLAAGLSACARKPERYRAYAYDLFDTYVVITGYETDKARFDAAAGALLELFGRIHRLTDIYHEYEGMNNARTVNLAAGGDPVPVDGLLLDLLSQSVSFHALTGGKLNVCMGSVLLLWRDPVPAADALAEAALHTDISRMVIDREAGTVTLTDPGMSLDLGAVAKGYAAELGARWLLRNGYAGYSLDLGGNIRTVGSKPDGSGWIIGIGDPLDGDGERGYVETVAVTDGSLVTSGSYERYAEVDGVRYHHIIDPGTLFPRDTYLSVSVLSEDSGLADALSTGLFNMDPEEGLALVASLPGTEAFWILSDGTSFRSGGWPGTGS